MVSETLARAAMEELIGTSGLAGKVHEAARAVRGAAAVEPVGTSANWEDPVGAFSCGGWIMRKDDGMGS